MARSDNTEIDRLKRIASVSKGTLIVGCLVVGLYLRATVLAYGWNRFAVHGLGAAPLAPAMAFGVATMLAVMLPSNLAAENKREWSDTATRAIVWPLLSWALLAIVWEIAR